MAKTLVFVLAGLSLLVLGSCSLAGYVQRREQVPNDYVGRKTMEIHNIERETREWSYWMQDFERSRRY